MLNPTLCSRIDLIALLGTGMSFSMPSLIGMIDACHKRARPVIMTTLAIRSRNFRPVPR